MTQPHAPVASIFDLQGPLTGSVKGLARLVAESEAFQERTEKYSFPAALSRIFRWSYQEAPRVVHAERPFAVVWPADELTLSRYATGAGGFTQRGGVVLVLTDKDRYPAEGREASGDNFCAWVDQVLLEMRDRAGVDDRIALSEPTLLRAPLHSRDVDAKAEGAFWDVIFLMRWGP